MNKMFIASSILMFSTSVFAKDTITYYCKSNQTERVIDVVYSTEDSVPCDVNYTKDGATKTLWHYDNTPGKCESHAADFTNKQISMGFDCSQAQTATNAVGTSKVTDNTADAE